jgi:hypothetical protein
VALVGRILVVIVSFLLSCVAAALVMAFAFLLPSWSDLFIDPAAYYSFAVVVGLSATLFAAFALLPAMLIIALAEGFRWRSALFYAIAAGALALVPVFGWDYAAPMEGPREFGGTREILAAAGIVGGFVYWMLAGRNAGNWHGARSHPL